MNDQQSPVTRTAGSPRALLTALGLLTLALFVIRLTGPSNLMDNDQERPAAYVLDATLHGHWFCQRDWTGDIMSKPPLFTWIAAAATLPVGHGNLVSLYFPCLVAMLAIVWMLFHFGSHSIGWRAGFLAALIYLAAPAGVKHIALARTDGLFAATIALAAFLGYRAWNGRGSWMAFWFAAALATLTKGPLGLVLGAMGLLAAGWERFDQTRKANNSPGSIEGQGIARPAGRFWVSQLLGVLLFAAISGGWFYLAYREAGQPFLDKVIGRELVGHLVGAEHGRFGVGFVKAPLYWLSRFLPWSLLAVVGLWRVYQHPSSDRMERRFERFLFCWIMGGLVLFSLATHQRGDLPLPLYVPAALLAGRELARRLAQWSDVQLLRRSLAAAGVFLIGCVAYLHLLFSHTDAVRQSEGIESLARRLRADPVVRSGLLHLDSPYALQFHLNTMNRAVTSEAAAAALAGEAPAFVAVRDLDKLNRFAGNGSGSYGILARWPEERRAFVQIVTNLPGRPLRRAE